MNTIEIKQKRNLEKGNGELRVLVNCQQILLIKYNKQENDISLKNNIVISGLNVEDLGKEDHSLGLYRRTVKVRTEEEAKVRFRSNMILVGPVQIKLDEHPGESAQKTSERVTKLNNFSNYIIEEGE